MNANGDPNNYLSEEYSWNPKYPSIRSWRLKNFKSVKNPSEVRLAPLTVIVGANSAGKSSLIQSILLMAQNASSVLRNSAPQFQGKFEFNSFLVQLGTVGETLCDLGERDRFAYLSVGGLWYMGAGGNSAAQRTLLGMKRSNELESQNDLLEGPLFLEWNINLSAFENNNSGGIAIIKDSIARVVESSQVIEQAEVSEKKVRPALRGLISKFDYFSFEHRAVLIAPEQPELPFDSNNEQASDLARKDRLEAVSFQSGLPVSGLKTINILEYIFDHQKALYSGDLESEFQTKSLFGLYKDKTDVFESLDAAALEFARQAFEIARAILQQDQIVDDLNLTAVAHRVETEPLIEHYRIPFSKKVHRSSRDSGADKLMRVLYPLDTNINKFLKLAKMTLLNNYSESDLIHQRVVVSLKGHRNLLPDYGQSLSSRAIGEWNHFLSNSVVYLGPLRSGPRSTYGLGTGTENANIPLGESGEFLAKKLFNERTLRSYPILQNGNLRSALMTLEEAVTFWYQELSSQTGDGNSETPSESIEVQAPGRLGYLLNIGSRTLANVGFGISQVLPVLALCLDSNPGTTILLEQPELHLNPGMQQKLGDFLLYMAKTGRQIIVETHSEYLITRLRRNAASNSEDHKFFGVIFVERDRVEGTSYRAVNVNDRGDLSEWPKGFFDHVAEDLRVLMRKAAERQVTKSSE